MQYQYVSKPRAQSKCLVLVHPAVPHSRGYAPRPAARDPLQRKPQGPVPRSATVDLSLLGFGRQIAGGAPQTAGLGPCFWLTSSGGDLPNWWGLLRYARTTSRGCADVQKIKSRKIRAGGPTILRLSECALFWRSIGRLCFGLVLFLSESVTNDFMSLY